jgi:hypothetical protein
MSEGLENVYGLLDDEDKEEKTEETETENEEDVEGEKVEKKEEKEQKDVIEKSSGTAVEELKDDNGDSSWTDVSSTKTRKTAMPVASLFNKPEGGGDRAARGSSTVATLAAVATPAFSTAANQSSEAPKKKGERSSCGLSFASSSLSLL